MDKTVNLKIEEQLPGDPGACISLIFIFQAVNHVCWECRSTNNETHHSSKEDGKCMLRGGPQSMHRLIPLDLAYKAQWRTVRLTHFAYNRLRLPPLGVHLQTR